MKKITQLFSLLFLLTGLFISNAEAGNCKPLPATAKQTNNLAYTSSLLLNRLGEIEKMEYANLSKTEKANLKQEVKAIEKQLKTMDGGVYLSVGAIIIILLLLVLLF